jgi:superfamily II DNA or RNA helicase
VGNLPLPLPTDAQKSNEISCDWLDVLPPQADCLRDYQREMMARLAGALREYRRILAQAPTGSGKTHCIATLVAAALAVGMRVLVLATRTRLVRQLHDRLVAFDVPHGVMAAGLPGMADSYERVQVASVDTLYRRCIVDERMALPGADVVVFDEAHLALGDSRKKLLQHYPAAWLFGFTATPAKTSGRALKEQFDKLILGPSVRELIAVGMLVKARVFSRPVVTAAELDDVSKDSTTGDYALGELSALLSRPKLVGDVVTNWLRIANGKRTLVFSCDKAHGAQITTEFRQAGIAAEQLTDEDSDEDREAAIARLERGETLILVNCFLLSYGIDIPLVDCIVLARPTRSVVLYLQAIGRGMRPAEAKDSVIVIDHGRVVETLGMPTDNHGWSLAGKNVNQLAREKLSEKRREGIEKPRTCKECSAMWIITEEGTCCPNCGWKPIPFRKAVQVEDAELQELTATAESTQWERFFQEAVGWYMQRWPEKWMEKPNSGRAYAWHKARAKYKIAEEKIPSRCWRLEPLPPSPATVGYMQSQIIRWAKGQAKQKKHQQQKELQQAEIRWG